MTTLISIFNEEHSGFFKIKLFPFYNNENVQVGDFSKNDFPANLKKNRVGYMTKLIGYNDC
jgi:hypothetical protein